LTSRQRIASERVSVDTVTAINCEERMSNLFLAHGRRLVTRRNAVLRIAIGNAAIFLLIGLQCPFLISQQWGRHAGPNYHI
jgi:hypothetical protein